MKFIAAFFKPNAFTTGLAMFAMFFGSGNLIFPLGVGQMAGEETIWALIGLFITAVFMPFATLCLMMFFNGDYDAFLTRIGKIPGRIVVFIILALIGPFGVLPRCIAFSYSTFSIYFNNISLETFALVSCLIIFLFSIKTNRVVGLIGNILTPILLISLGVIIFKGLFVPTEPGPAIEHLSKVSMILKGMVEGYKTFDIFAAIFFATAIIPAFKNVLGEKMIISQKSIIVLAIKSSIIGMFLLFAIYAGLGLVSGNLRGVLLGIPSDKLLGNLTNIVMGSTGGVFANLVVIFACLTTAITLAVVSADFFQKEVFLGKINYVYSLILTMIISFIFACLGFDGIMKLVLPVLIVLAPSIIALIIASAFERFFGFKYIKQTFYLVLSLSFAINFLI